MENNVFFYIGLTADLITITLLVVNLIISLKTRAFSLNDRNCCRFETFYQYKTIPKNWRKFEDGAEVLDVEEIVYTSGDIDKMGYFIMMIPNAHNVIRNVEIYIYKSFPAQNGPSLKKNYRLLKEIREVYKPICINGSKGAVLPQIIVQWDDKYGKHRYYSNSEMIVNNRDCNDNLF